MTTNGPWPGKSCDATAKYQRPAPPTVEKSKPSSLCALCSGARSVCDKIFRILDRETIKEVAMKQKKKKMPSRGSGARFVEECPESHLKIISPTEETHEDQRESEKSESPIPRPRPEGTQQETPSNSASIKDEDEGKEQKQAGLTIKEAAKVLGVDRGILRAALIEIPPGPVPMLAPGKVPCRMIGKVRRIFREDLFGKRVIREIHYGNSVENKAPSPARESGTAWDRSLDCIFNG
jgi:hypothetical protein